jgi:DNA-binding protein H-NS
MSLDLEQMSLAELKQLRKDVDAAVNSYHEREKAKAREVLEQRAKELGFTLDEITGKKGKRAKPQAKYRNPEAPTETWSGRGRRPKWLEEKLSNGASLEDFRV